MTRNERHIRALARRVATLSRRGKVIEERRKVAASELLPLLGDRKLAVDVRGIIVTVSVSEVWAFPLKADTTQDKRLKRFIVARESGEA